MSSKVVMNFDRILNSAAKRVAEKRLVTGTVTVNKSAHREQNSSDYEVIYLIDNEANKVEVKEVIRKPAWVRMFKRFENKSKKVDEDLELDVLFKSAYIKSKE